jgi:hypothetical protein
MKKIAITLLLILVFSNSFAQKNDIWVSFYNQDSTKIGFKDKRGTIKIEPKFVRLTSNQKFENIIATIEEASESWNSYYLTKSGKKVGENMLFMFDNSPDCENEGFIRFTDEKTEKTGLFDKDGNVVIPAEYNYLTNVRNGLVVALKGATKKYDGEHYSYVGGKNYLLDVKNNILIDNIKINEDLDFYSLEKSKTPSKNPIRKSFLAKDGSYYSFVDYEKELKQWLKNELLNKLTIENLEKNSLDVIQFWDKEADEWKKSTKKDFIAANFEFLKKNLLASQNSKENYFSIRGLNPFMYDGPEFEQYYNNCGEALEWKFPVISVIINKVQGKILEQNAIDFLRTENGYKIIEVGSQKDNLK